jgi:hypothetical protein
LASYDFTNRGQETSLRNESQSLRDQIGSIKEKIQVSDKAIIEWEGGINKKHEVRKGVQIDLAKTLIEQLKKKYRIQGLTINISAPEKRDGITNTRFIDVQYSKLTLNFIAHTDIDAYLFISDLQKQLPGYVIVKELSLIAVNQITEEILIGIEKGDKKDIVSVKVDMLWQDLADKPGVTEQKTSNNSGDFFLNGSDNQLSFASLGGSGGR